MTDVIAIPMDAMMKSVLDTAEPDVFRREEIVRLTHAETVTGMMADADPVKKLHHAQAVIMRSKL